MGRSITDLSPTQISTFLKVSSGGTLVIDAVSLTSPSQITVCSLLTYSLTITSVKLSLLLLYRRIFDTPAFRRRSLVVGVACVVWWVVEVFTDIFQCHPFEAAFDPASLFTNRCINLQSYYFGITASNMGLDIIMLLLPLHMVWNLKLPIKQKVCLSGIFSMGFL